MRKPSPEGPASRPRPLADSLPASFSELCHRLFRLTSGDSRSWIASARVDSTSSQARRFLESCRNVGTSKVPPCCFLAWEQSGGRGRGGREWSSEAGLGLYMTFLLPGLSPTTIAQLPMAVAIIVARAVSHGLERPARVKWPNDVLSRGRKLSGILLESWSRGAADTEALVGVGINVHHTCESLPVPGATSLALEGATDPDIAQLAAEIGQSLSKFLEAPIPMAEVVDEYRIWSQHTLGDRLRCRVGNEVIEGEFAGFDPGGALLLERRGRVRRLTSSEIVEA